MQNISRTLLTLFLAVALVAPASAQDDDAQAKLDKLAKAKLKSVASAHKKLASMAMKLGLGRAGCRHYLEVLEIDPDDSSTRRKLGMKKDGKDWVQDKPMPKVDKVKGNAWESANKKLLSAEEKAYSKCAKQLFALGEEAKQLKLDEAAESYFSRAISYDPDHKGARKALGWERNEDKHWVQTAQSDWLYSERTSKGEAVAEKSEFEEALGVTMARRNSKRVLLVGALSDKELTDLMVHANATINSFHNLFKLRAFIGRVAKGRQVKIVFVANDKLYSKFIDTFSQKDTNAKKFKKSLPFCYVSGEVKTHLNKPVTPKGREYLRDRVVYLTGNRLAHGICGGNAPPWIAEGVAWGLTLRVLGTKYNLSVSLQDTSTAYGRKNWTDHTRWRSFLREMVLLGDPPAPSSVLTTKDWNQITNDKAAYAWSMVEFLWDKHPEKFAKYCEALDDGSSAAEACKEAFGMSMTELDAAWRAFVKSHY